MKAFAGLGAWPVASSAAPSRRNSSCAYIFLHEKFVFSAHGPCLCDRVRALYTRQTQTRDDTPKRKTAVSRSRVSWRLRPWPCGVPACRDPRLTPSLSCALLDITWTWLTYGTLPFCLEFFLPPPLISAWRQMSNDDKAHKARLES